MRILFLSISIFFSTSTILANEYKDAWSKTSYTIQNLFSEVDFQPEVCQKNIKEFTACMVALNFLANNLAEPLQFRIDVLAENPVLLVKKTGEEGIETQLEQFKESLAIVFNQETPIDISKHYWRLFKLAKALEVDVAYIAGETMNTYLKLAYDPHSVLLPKELIYKEPDNFFGIGSYIIKDRLETADDKESPTPVVIKPMKGSPAMKAGLKTGDLLFKVNGVDALTLSIDEIATAIRGPEGTTVTLTIQRFCTGAVEEVPVTRGPITVAPDIEEDSYYVDFDPVNADIKKSTCETKVADPEKPQALYVPIERFVLSTPGETTLCEKFHNLLEKDMQNSNSVGLIVDLRGNPGGDVDEVACMLDALISSEDVLYGSHLVQKGEVQEDWDDYYYFSTYSVYDKPVIVLTNAISASASEIFAGTIQDMKRGWVVGDKTFGKGSIQTLHAHTFEENQPQIKTNYMGADTIIKKTTGIYFLNSGRSPQLLGITPDFRYSPTGNLITKDNEEAKEFSENVNVIKGFKNIEWIQNRPEEMISLTACAQKSESLSQMFLQKSLAGLPENLSVITNFQDLLARDILACMIWAPQE